MDELLTNIDLKYYCDLLKLPLNNILNKDLFKTIKSKIGCYIINMQDSDDGNGSHWTGLIINKDIAIFYDSFGLAIPPDIIHFVRRFNKNMKIIYSIDGIQNIKSILCGWYVLEFFYFYYIQNKNCKAYKQLLNIHNNQFINNNSIKNDDILKSKIKLIFRNII